MVSSVLLLELLQEANCRISTRRSHITEAIMGLAMEVVSGAVAAGAENGRRKG